MAILSVLANPKDFSRAITPWKAPGGGGYSFMIGLIRDVPLDRVWFLTSLS